MTNEKNLISIQEACELCPHSNFCFLSVLSNAEREKRREVCNVNQAIIGIIENKKEFAYQYLRMSEEFKNKISNTDKIR